MSKPNFRIIEGDYQEEDYDAIKKDYMDLTISRNDILKKHNLSPNRYSKIIADIKKETGFSREKGHNLHLNPDHYLRENKHGRWSVVKHIHGEYHYWGTYPDRETAVMIRDKLKEHDWDLDYSVELIERYSISSPKNSSENSRCKYEGNNSHHKKGDAVIDALAKYDEFEKHYFEGKLSVNGILDALDFTHRQYSVCLNHLRELHGYTTKKHVRDVL